MRKHQDVGAIEDANTSDEKLGIAIHGRLEVSGAMDAIGRFQFRNGFEIMRDEGTVLASDTKGNVIRKKPNAARLKAIEQEFGSLQKYYDTLIEKCDTAISKLVVKALKDRNKEFFLHLAALCDEDDYIPTSQASRLDVLVLLLRYKSENIWPNVDMTRADLEQYLARHGEGGIDPKTLSAVVKRTGIKLRRDKPGPRPERKSRQ